MKSSRLLSRINELGFDDLVNELSSQVLIPSTLVDRFHGDARALLAVVAVFWCSKVGLGIEI